MKKKIIVIIISLVLGACNSDENYDLINYDTEVNFLSEIRPDYFKNLNWDSEEVINLIPSNLDKFYNVYKINKIKYSKGLFTSNSDLYNYGLLGRYYSFYLLALTAGVLDGNLTIEQINGNRNKGLYSGVDVNNIDFKQLELEAMMSNSRNIANQATFVNGYNDMAYGFYLATCQVYQRVKNRNNLCSLREHKMLTDFSFVWLNDYREIPVWNLMMPLVAMSNYDDELNTFDNQEMNSLLFTINARIIPGMLEKKERYAELLGPIYKFDINMKKIDWLINKQSGITADEIKQFDNSIEMMNGAVEYINKDLSSLVSSWRYKSTYEKRLKYFNQILKYRNSFKNEDRPELKNFISSKEFRKSYQCYTCHEIK